MVSPTYQAVEQLRYMVDFCPLMRSESPVCLTCSTSDMTATVLSNAMGFSYAGFSRGIGSWLWHLHWRFATMVSTLSSEAKLGLSSQLWPNLTIGQLWCLALQWCNSLLLNVWHSWTRCSQSYPLQWVLQTTVYFIGTHIFATLG